MGIFDFVFAMFCLVMSVLKAEHPSYYQLAVIFTLAAIYFEVGRKR